MWGHRTATFDDSLQRKVSGINHLENESLWKNVMGLMYKEFKNIELPHSLVNLFCFFFDIGLVSVLEILTRFPETQILSCVTRTWSAESKRKTQSCLLTPEPNLFDSILISPNSVCLILTATLKISCGCRRKRAFPAH